MIVAFVHKTLTANPLFCNVKMLWSLLSDPNSDGCAVFRFNSDSTGDAEFVEYTQLAFTISGREIHSYIDGVELPSDQPANVEGFEIKAESDFKVHGGKSAQHIKFRTRRDNYV